MSGDGTLAAPGVRELAAAGPFQALAHQFAVRGDDAGLVTYLADVFAPLAADPQATDWYELKRGERLVEVTFAGERLVSTDDPAEAVGMLIWHVNRQAVERSRHLVRLHAAVASRVGEAVLLPAAMEAGKTTLVAGLVQAGLDYLSDEVGALDPDSLDVIAYPKALSVDEGSWDVLPKLRPVLDDAVAGRLPHQWQVPATSIRPGACAARARARFVVFPRYEPGAASRLASLGAADATVRLASCTFELEQQPDRELPVLARLAEQADCYDLRVGDLESACRLVLALYDENG